MPELPRWNAVASLFFLSSSPGDGRCTSSAAQRVWSLLEATSGNSPPPHVPTPLASSLRRACTRSDRGHNVGKFAPHDRTSHSNRLERVELPCTSAPPQTALDSAGGGRHKGDAGRPHRQTATAEGPGSEWNQNPGLRFVSRRRIPKMYKPNLSWLPGQPLMLRRSTGTPR
jgi:hypothetical protein